MPRYIVGIHGDDLDPAEDALHSGGISAGRTEGTGSSGSYDVVVARIDAETADAALARVREHLPPDGSYTLGPTVGRPIRAKFLDERRASAPNEDMRKYRALELQRALVAEPQVGDQVRVQGVDLFEDAVRVHFALPQGEGDDEEGSWDQTRMLLTDDVGTEYYPAGGGSGGGGGNGWLALHGHNWFTPAVPDGASRLTVATLFGDLTFEL